MSNSNYNIGLQRLKPVYTAYCGLHNLAENWSWARDVNGRDRDEIKIEYYQNCSVLGCVTHCSQSAAHLYEQFLQVHQIGFVTLGPLRCA